MASNQAAGLLRQAATLPIIQHPTSPLVARALDISLAYQRHPYDGLFLALAEFRRDMLLTLDQRLGNGLHGTPLERFVQVVG
ncbi:MAG: type II toxin-antitoxin system VapC family toxin [Planctomycetota bacterium]